MKRVGSFFCKILPFLPFFILGLAVFLLRKKLVGVFAPVLIAGLLAYMLEPLVNFVQKHMKIIRKNTRLRAVQVVFVLFVVSVVVVVAFFVPTIVSNVAEIMEKANDIVPKTKDLLQRLISNEHPAFKEKVLGIVDSVINNLSLKINSVYDSAKSFSLYSKISDAIIGVITSLVLTYYFLKDKIAILNGLYGLFPYNWRQHVSETAYELGMISSKFIQGQFFVAVIIGFLEAIGLFFLGIPYSAFFGIIGGISNMIPYFGPFIGAILPALTALAIAPSKALWVLGLFLLVQQIDNHFISPKIIGGNLGIHPATVILLIFIAQKFFGIFGIVVAVPVFAALKCVAVKVIKIICSKREIV